MGSFDPLSYPLATFGEKKLPLPSPMPLRAPFSPLQTQGYHRLIVFRAQFGALQTEGYHRLKTTSYSNMMTF